MRTAVAISACLLAAAAGCDPSWEVAATVDASASEDAAIDGGSPTVTRPMVTGIAVAGAADGAIALAVDVRDAGSPTVDLLLAFACDGATAWRAVSTGDPLTGLTVTPRATTHVVRWDVVADVTEPGPHTCRVKVVALDPEGLSSEPLMAWVSARR